MNIIPCSFDCAHQEDGYCGLESISFVSSINEKCPYYEKKIPTKLIDGNSSFKGTFKSSDSNNMH